MLVSVTGISFTRKRNCMAVQSSSAYYDFMTNRQVQLEIEKAIPYGLPLIAQTHEVGLEFVTLTEQVES